MLCHVNQVKFSEPQRTRHSVFVRWSGGGSGGHGAVTACRRPRVRLCPCAPTPPSICLVSYESRPIPTAVNSISKTMGPRCGLGRAGGRSTAARFAPTGRETLVPTRRRLFRLGVASFHSNGSDGAGEFGADGAGADKWAGGTHT